MDVNSTGQNRGMKRGNGQGWSDKRKTKRNAFDLTSTGLWPWNDGLSKNRSLFVRGCFKKAGRKVKIKPGRAETSMKREKNSSYYSNSTKKEKKPRFFLHRVSWDNGGAQMKRTANMTESRELRKTEQLLLRLHSLLCGTAFERPSCYFQ